jgi:LysM repeat protein
MKRFLDKTFKKTVKEEKDLSMQGVARTQIREKLLENALKFGVKLNLREQAPPGEEKKPETGDEIAIRLIVGEEGFEPKWYPDKKHGLDAKTIGYGTRIDLPDFKSHAKECFGDQCDDFIRRAEDQTLGITEPEARKIASHSILKTYKPRVEELFPNFAQYPAEVQGTLISSAYRGAITGSPKTVDLINAGKYEEAAKEYINRKDYRDARLPENIKNYGGIADRMDREADAIRSLSKWSPTPPASSTTTTTTTSPTASQTTSTPPAPTPSTDLGFEEYEIKSGDTLSAIARRTGRNVEDISAASGIKDPNRISVGQKIKIPKG